MIIPCPVNFWEVKRYPLTWSMIAINTLIFVMFFMNARESSTWTTFFSDENMNLTGRIYQQYVVEISTESKARLPAWVSNLKPSADFQFQTLGAWALRDAKFLESAETLEVEGDRVALERWRVGVHQFKNSYYDQIVFRLGLSHLNRDSLAWITYQFSHSSFVHLASNMIYFLIIGTAVEAMIGSAGLVILYLTGGIFAGLLFLFMKTHGGAIPMVGASGSISALMAFYVLFEQRRRIRFAYLVSLHPRHHGFVYLPTLWMVPLFLVSDFSHHYSSIEGMGAGVAYTAHMGGTLFGAAMAIASRFLTPVKNSLVWEEVFAQETPELIEPEASWDDDEF